jgi:hypothetical protein
MNRMRALFALGATVLSAGATACALDFDQFEPVDASTPPPHADGSVEPPATDAEMSVPDAETTDGPDDAGVQPDAARNDAGRPADGGLDAAACTPSPSCLMMAKTCATMCMMQDQQCTMRCAGSSCRSNCTRTENTCIAQCEDTCSTCTRSAGCSAMSACADASTSR